MEQGGHSPVPCEGCALPADAPSFSLSPGGERAGSPPSSQGANHGPTLLASSNPDYLPKTLTSCTASLGAGMLLEWGTQTSGPSRPCSEFSARGNYRPLGALGDSRGSVQEGPGDPERSHTADLEPARPSLPTRRAPPLPCSVRESGNAFCQSLESYGTSQRLESHRVPSVQKGRSLGQASLTRVPPGLLSSARPPS